MKKFLSCFLCAVLLLSPAACGTPAKTTGSPDELPLKDILYLFNDMSGLGLTEYCVMQPLDADGVAGVLGSEGFDLPFEEGMRLAPLMSTSAFELAVFRLAEGADGAAFAARLEELADPMKWICVGASRVETWVFGRQVAFLMGSAADATALGRCVETMLQPDFLAEEHLADPLAGLSAAGLYDQLEELYGLEMYGCLDGDYQTELAADNSYGLALPARTAEILVDDHAFPAEEYDGERACLLVICKLKAGADAAQAAAGLASALDTSALKGESPYVVTAWKGDTAFCFAGSGSLAWTAMDLETRMANVYRMETQGVQK